MQTRIPLPSSSHELFGDALDYLEKIRKRKSDLQQTQNEATEKKREFEINKALQQAGLNETHQFHQQSLAQGNQLKPLQMQLLQARIDAANKSGQEIKLSPQERAQSMKLIEQGRSIKSVLDRTHGIKKLLDENPDLTGYGTGFKALLGKPGGKVGEFIEKAGNLQSAIGRVASQRGGAAVLKWAEKVKPGVWKDTATNKGMVSSILQDSGSDFNEAKDEYEALTGKPFPIKMPTGGSGKKVKVKDNQTGEVHEMDEEEAKKLMEGG
jgi:hypothetical protein